MAHHPSTMPFRRPLFFIHVMKTAGGTFHNYLKTKVGQDNVFPNPTFLQGKPATVYMTVATYTDLTPAERAKVWVYSGHVPFATVDLMGDDLETLTILREPVERTISWLKHAKRLTWPDWSFEEIYEHPYAFEMFVRDHQAKMFAFTADDSPAMNLDGLAFDDQRLEVAKENLERVDLFGLQESFDVFLDEVDTRYGWSRQVVANRNVAEPMEVPASFRRRIADDNPADLAFYEYARELHRRRRQAATTTTFV